MKRKYIYITVVLGFFGFFSLHSCNLDPTLEQSKDLDRSIKKLEDLQSLILGGYEGMGGSAYYGRNVIIYSEVRSDNTYANGRSNRFVFPGMFAMTNNDGYAGGTWGGIYKVVLNANLLINRDITTISGDISKVKYVIGEAYLMRALAHFDLLRFYGQYYVGSEGMQAKGIPYVKEFKTDNSLYPARGTVQENYDQIISDIDQALQLMDPKLDKTSNNFFSSYAALAVKARVALYFKDYALAESAAKKIIEAGKYTIADANNFSAVWSAKQQPNVIFAIAKSATDNLGINGLSYIYRLTPSGAGYGDIAVLRNLYEAYDAGDVRAEMIAPYQDNNYGEFYNKGKYPDTINFRDDIPLIRYEEVLLIYAEALLYNGKAAEALTWLNKIPKNRRAKGYTEATLENILLERRKELAFEGFRFDDLVRTGKEIPYVDVRQTFKGSIPYGDPRLAFPIPNVDMSTNPNLTQNQGY
ncbi:MAG: RagB/SusD family nutrient uptake outer membrane protein [Bergeyella sp.]|nr:RagB/SusD family nutrient uptake outer membrane protein [Bergeyella sp.]